MSIRKIARMGHPVLRQKARLIKKEELQTPEFHRLLADMVDTMREYGGIGLAAPQIHESISVALIDYEDENPRYADIQKKGKKGAKKSKKAEEQVLHSLPLSVFINPKITVLDEKLQGFWEGCLSVPELRGLVYRPRKIRVDFWDLSGQARTLVAEDFLATVFQHELDHLAGVLYVDRVKVEPGKNVLSFTEEYGKFLVPGEDDDVGELDD
jgi:peptide deformylase